MSDSMRETGSGISKQNSSINEAMHLDSPRDGGVKGLRGYCEITFLIIFPPSKLTLRIFTHEKKDTFLMIGWLILTACKSV